MSAGAGTKQAPIKSSASRRGDPAILDASALADAPVETDDVAEALVRYEQGAWDRSRRSGTPTAAAGRRGDRRREALAPDGFDDV